MSERLQNVFREPPTGMTRLVAYLMAGDPSPESTLRRLAGLAENGVDILELGIPFSDPIADGPVIQAAGQRALSAGMTLAKTLGIVRQFRLKYDTPVILMGYLNPMLCYGWEKFIQDAVNVGVDALIIPDLPYKEGEGLRKLTYKLAGKNITFIPMIAQTSQQEDIECLAAEDQGFAYVLTRNGITGGEAEIPSRVIEFLDQLRNELRLPCCAGFGIQSREQVERLAGSVDGVVVGSALIKRFVELDRQNLNEAELEAREKEVFQWLKSLIPFKTSTLNS